MKDAYEVQVVLETSQGRIEMTVYPSKAPASARAFLALLDDGSFTRYGAFYRAVRKGENDNGFPPIDVIQGGWLDPPSSLAAVEHEPTSQSGLRHLEGTVSLARGAVGTATGAAFFICIDEHPALDAGGERNSDGQGFAAFGRVMQGMDTVRAIHRLPTARFARDPYMTGQLLDPPVRILKAARKQHAEQEGR